MFGAEVAARRHFGKPAAALTAEEAAKLAAVLPNPRRYRVDGTSKYVERRAKVIYSIMAKRGIVVPEYEEVVAAPPEEITEASATSTTEKENLPPAKETPESYQEEPK